MDFHSIYGNEALKAHLQSALADGRLSHAYLITGPEGSGKHTIAMVFAKALRCTGSGEAPCGRCGSCWRRRAQRGVN